MPAVPSAAPRTSPPAPLPFALSFLIVPLVLAAAAWGGWWLAAVPLYGWVLVTILDRITGPDTANPDTATPDSALVWHRAITIVWFPVQAALVFGLIHWTQTTDHLSRGETVALFFGLGIATGAVGIVHAHELMHQKNRVERWLADLLLATVLYSHFRSEHLRVHHLWVGTPRDAVSARYNEGFHRYLWRVLRDCPRSAWAAETALLARRGLPWWHRANPFWRYAALQGGALALAFVLGGWAGLGLFVLQAAVAVWQLELTNYVEHYGLTRKHLGEGKYEHVLPRHSWNAAQLASNRFFINLQRHSDHHYKPDRRYPLLQTWGPGDAPQLPLGYPAMTALAMVPPLWRRVMNPRVRAWRRRFYPEIADWTPYNRGTNPPPRGAV